MREAYRLVRSRLAQGEAAPGDAVDAEAVLNRAELDYIHSTFDYLIALARLHYAMGTPLAARLP